MKMNKTNYKQYDTRWAKLGYPKSPYFIKDCGCGEVSIANCIIEMQKYTKETPKTIQPYCKQYAAPNGNGTYFSGIPKMMVHYGMTEVKEHQTMASLWKELAKGDRVAIYLMGNRKGGSKGVHWTSCAHFVCSVGYKVKDGEHYVYVKDSNSTSELRNGWISYEDNMRGDVSRVWSGKLNGTLYTEPTKPYVPTTPYKGKLPSKTVKKGSKGDDTKAVQTFLNWCINAKLSVDGDCGSNTTNAITKWQKQYEKAYGLVADGVFGTGSIKAAKQIVAKYAPKTPTKADKILSACKTQAEWMKNYKYKWQSKPTIEKSKKYGTCVTYVACVLQRLGYLKSGQYIWHNTKGKVIGATSKMTVSYPGGTLKALKGKLKAGDVVIAGDKNDVAAGSHIFIVTGKWSGDNPYIWDNHSAERVKAGKTGAHTYNGTKKVIAVIRLK